MLISDGIKSFPDGVCGFQPEASGWGHFVDIALEEVVRPFNGGLDAFRQKAEKATRAMITGRLLSLLKSWLLAPGSGHPSPRVENCRLVVRAQHSAQNRFGSGPFVRH